MYTLELVRKKFKDDFLTISQLAGKMGISRSMAERHIACLKYAGELEIKKYGNATAFKLKGRKP